MYCEISTISMRAEYTQYANLCLTGHCILIGKVTKLKIKQDNKPGHLTNNFIVNTE